MTVLKREIASKQFDTHGEMYRCFMFGKLGRSLNEQLVVRADAETDSQKVDIHRIMAYDQMNGRRRFERDYRLD